MAMMMLLICVAVVVLFLIRASMAQVACDAKSSGLSADLPRRLRQ